MPVLRNTTRFFARLTTLCALALAGLCAFGVSAPILPAAAQSAAAKKPAAKPKVVADDYLVMVGKHVMWKSQVLIMHPEMAKTAKPLSRKDGSDYMVQVGKTPVWASSLRRVAGTDATRPAKHDAMCQDYLVQTGKKTVWASEIGAPCPAGTHKGEQKPLCCVAPLQAGKDLMPCCKDGTGQ